MDSYTIKRALHQVLYAYNLITYFAYRLFYLYNNYDITLLKEHSTKNILRCKQEIVLTLGYLRSLKGQLFLGKEELFIKVCKIRYNLQLATGIPATNHWSINIALMTFVIT